MLLHFNLVKILELHTQPVHGIRYSQTIVNENMLDLIIPHIISH